MRRFFFLIAFISVFSLNINAQVDLEKLLYHPWVDSVFNSLTAEQKIAQLVWVNAYSDDNYANQDKIATLIKNYNVGGVIFFKGELAKQAQLTNLYQSLAQIPLLISMDAEWGIGMRLTDVNPLPYNMELGATRDLELVKRSAAEVARQMKIMGIHMSLGPDVDINSQPLNPVIGMRSFGEDPELVTNSGLAYIEGLQENGIMAVAKHFPGHGGTTSDSHYTLPVLTYDEEHMKTVELYPFQKTTEKGVAGVMTAHLHVPSLDADEGIPASLSPKIVDGVLRKQWNYKGLIITDAMNMKGASNYGDPEQINVKALKAGNDIVLYPIDAAKTINAVLDAIKKKELSKEDIDLKCRRVLAAKLWAGLNQKHIVETENLQEEINSPKAELLQRKIIESSLTLLKNQNNLIPLKKLDTLKVATLSVGQEDITPFQSMLENYMHVEHFNLPEVFTQNDIEKLKGELKDFNLVLVGIHSMYKSRNYRLIKLGDGENLPPRNPYGVTEELEELLEYLSLKKNAVVTYFSSPYALGEIKNLKKAKGVILAYQDKPLNQELAAQMIFGGIAAQGKLPVSIPGTYNVGDGLTTEKPIRLKYTLPEEVGINTHRIKAKVDSIVYSAIDQEAFPGCNILVAKDGKVIFQEAYGYQTYDKLIPARQSDIYDLASVTKVCGALPCVMKLNEQGKFSMDEKFSTYWPDWKNSLFHKSNKEDIIIRDILAHQAGLIPYINYYTQTMENGKLMPKYYFPEQDEQYSLAVAPGLYLDEGFKKDIYKSIRLSKLNPKGKYEYSGLFFIIAPELVGNLSGEKFTDFLYSNFYRPLGAYTTMYNPYGKFPMARLVPTEYDSNYRKRLVQGTVHDEAAATLGGVSGNAGLFSTANDLAKMLQMYVQMGNYGGEQYISASVMKEFTRVQFPENNNRRGLGFDKPLLDNKELSLEDAYPSPGVSAASFGHTGFTGIMVWMDPENQLIYIFMSNRVYPTRENNNLSKLNVRTNILQAFYDELDK